MMNENCVNFYEEKFPEPPKELEEILDEYQNFLSSVFTRDYKKLDSSKIPVCAPSLTGNEQKYIESLTRKLHSNTSWKEYTRQFMRWAIQG